MRVIIVSGLSGAGKSVALHTLEDDGFYCIDNLPSLLLPDLLQDLHHSHLILHEKLAVGIDARSAHTSIDSFPSILETLKATDDLQVEVLFLQTETRSLVQRFSETRRKHPLSLDGTPLLKAIEKERELLETIQTCDDLVIDTTSLNLHQLREIIHNQLLRTDPERMSILFQSFGFKHGVPSNTDFVFDVRCLPNPHWDPGLRQLTGKDEAVGEFLSQHESVEKMFAQIQNFLESWIPVFQSENRAYLTVSIGCTGGQHRSVYLAERLHEYFARHLDNISVRHREL